MTKNTTFYFRIGFVLIVSLSFTAFAFLYKVRSTISASAEEKTYFNFISTKNRKKYNPNTQTYITDNNESHTIYWTQGITPPKMDSEKSGNLGQPGYFRMLTEGTTRDFKYPMKDGDGYYDLNKDNNTNNCYLHVAADLLHWWMDQNKEYIDKYLSHLSNDQDTVYNQPTDLFELKPHKSDVWNNILTHPVLKNHENNYTQYLKDDIMSNQVFQNFLNSNDGYFFDLVIDYFINGYQGVKSDVSSLEPNKEDNFVPDKTGGYFYPIFARQLLTTRKKISDYVYYKNTLKEKFNSGYGVSLSFSSDESIHSIACWGAEYNDETGELVRIFFTDSDDYQDFLENETSFVTTGMRAYDVYESSGAVYLSNNISSDRTPERFIRSIGTLDLAQNIWEQKENNLDPPSPPTFIKDLSDVGYAIGSETDYLEVGIDIKDSSYFSYQWYEGENETDEGQLIPGATSDRYKPPTPVQSVDLYYYCRVTVYLNGKKAEGTTKHARIYLDETKVDAQKPEYTFDPNLAIYAMFQKPNIITISPSVSDGGKLTYQWYSKESSDIRAVDGILMPGEVYPSLVPRTDKSTADAYMYYCVVTNSNPKATGKTEVSFTPESSYKVVINYEENSTLDNAREPMVVYQTPKVENNYAVDEELVLKYEARVFDGGILSLQWYKNGISIPNATEASYRVDTSKEETNSYYCVATNRNENAQSAKEVSRQSETYTIRVGNSPEKSSNNYLTTLGIEGFYLNETFNKYTLAYSLDVDNNVEYVNVIYVAEHPFATVQITGNSKLKVGTNAITVKVIAENGQTRDYIIYVNRADKGKSTNNYLSSLSVNETTMTPDFKRDVYEYEITIAKDIKNITISAVPEDSTASVKIQGLENLTLGKECKIVVNVTAENGDIREYFIIVNRVKSNNSHLSSLSVNGTVLTPSFQRDTEEYEITIANDAKRVEVNAVAEDADANIEIQGNDNLTICKECKIIVKVTAENGSVREYVINVKRENCNEENNSQEYSNDKSSSQTTAGIVVGVVLVIIVIIISIVLVIKKKKQNVRKVDTSAVSVELI